MRKSSKSGQLFKMGKAPKKEDYLVVDPRDVARSGFGNHMFCEYQKTKVYDACAGAAVGSYDCLGYMKTSIDTTILSRYRAYFEGDPKKYQGPVGHGLPKNRKRDRTQPQILHQSGRVEGNGRG